MLERNSTLTPSQIKKRLKATATPLAGFYAKDQGAGRINAAHRLLEPDLGEIDLNGICRKRAKRAWK